VGEDVSLHRRLAVMTIRQVGSCLQQERCGMAQLVAATCQFPVVGEIRKNRDRMVRMMRDARAAGAHVAHFCECSLGGYAGKEFASFDGYDWDLHRACVRDILHAAGKIGIWAIVGGNHRLIGAHKPHNSLYIVNSRGRLVDRYDKMFCTGADQNSGDLKHYSPGSHFSVFNIRGITCAALICFDFRFQELYRELYRRGVKVVFNSFHNGASKPAELKKSNIWGTIVPATLQTYAANNGMWISASNTSRKASCWPGFFVQPDGVITGRLVNNRAGMLLSKIETGRKFYDPSAPWRDRAMRGIYHSGTLVRDRRSSDRLGI
jgi:predicted amidohydrolase